MNDFKVGDRVVYEATMVTCTPSHEGHEGQITKVNNQESVSVKWDDSNLANRGGYLTDNLQLITPAPDVITINRADLPEVTEVGAWLMDGDWAIGGAHMDSSTAQKAALRYLAATEFLDARERSEKEAKGKLNRRRDVMAREMYLEAFGKDDGISYQSRNLLTQLCIDRIIELEDAAK